jgi:hypothetical protein
MGGTSADMKTEEILSADRNEVRRQVHEITEDEFKNAEPLLNAAPAEMKRWERLDMLTDVVSKKVLHWLVEHPELSQSAVELIIAPVVEERDRERLRKKRYRSEAGDRWVSLNPANP